MEREKKNEIFFSNNNHTLISISCLQTNKQLALAAHDNVVKLAFAHADLNNAVQDVHSTQWHAHAAVAQHGHFHFCRIAHCDRERGDIDETVYQIK